MKSKPKSSLKTQSNRSIKNNKISIASTQQSHHPDHSAQIIRLKKVSGQINGIEKMIQDKRYCPDIIAQLKAAASALKAIEAEILKTHLRGCVKQAFSSNDVFKSEEKIQEIIKLMY